jgi:anti-sigma B factor antagonist
MALFPRTWNQPMSKPQPKNVFSPEGAIDLHVSPEMRASLRELIDEKPKKLVVDLSRVPYVDSSGLAVLIGAMQSLEHEGGVFMLAGPQEAVRMILESARLDQYFKVFPTVDAALAAS